jgi:integrase
MERERVPNYKYGKIKDPLSFQDVQQKVEKARKHLTLESLAFFWLLYYCGCRKSEGFERKVSDIVLESSYFIIDFGQRKKHGDTVPPLKLPRSFPGVDLLVQQWQRASQRKASRKLVLISEPTGEMRKTTKGMKPVKKNVGVVRREKWFFPHVNKSWALVIVKRILGKNYYPHFLRLNRLTEIGKDPTANITRMKSFSGIRDIKTLEDYLGTSQEEQDMAVMFIGKQIKKENRKK